MKPIVLLAAAGICSVLAGCSGQANAGEVPPLEPSDVASLAASPSAPAAADSSPAPPSDKYSPNPNDAGFTPSAVSESRRIEIEAALEAYMRESPGAVLNHFYALDNSPDGALVAANVTYRGRIVKLTATLKSAGGSTLKVTYAFEATS